MTDYTLATLLHPDVLAEYSETVEYSNLKAGDEVACITFSGLGIAGDRVTGTGPSGRSVFLNAHGLLNAGAKEIRRKPKPTPQWPDMAPLTSLGQMAEGLRNGEARVVYRAANSQGVTCFDICMRLGDEWECKLVLDSWDKVLQWFDPGTLHPITPEPVELTDEQVRMYTSHKTKLLTGNGEVTNGYREDDEYHKNGPYSLIHYPKEK